MWIWLPLTVYLLLDATGYLFGGEWQLFWEKYRVTVPLMAIAGLMLLAGKRETTAAVFAGMGAAALAVVPATLFRYFGWNGLSLEYLLRFSLRRDYNMYATALLIGWIGLFFLLLEQNHGGTALVISAVILPVMLLSGSRRVLLAALVAIPAAAAALLLRRIGRGGTAKGAVGLLVASAAVWCLTLSLEQALHGLSEDPRSEQRTVQEGSSGQTAAFERYETIGDTSLFAKRKVIWRIAVRRLGESSGREWMLGRGGGENIRLYDRIGAELDDIYPDRELRLGALSAHNMLLADLLDGGLIKAAVLLWLLAACGLGSFRTLLADPVRGLALGMILGYTVAGNLVSNRYGLLYDRAFLLCYPLFALEAERKDPHE